MRVFPVEGDVHDFGRFNVADLGVDLHVIVFLGYALREDCDLAGGRKVSIPLFSC